LLLLQLLPDHLRIISRSEGRGSQQHGDHRCSDQQKEQPVPYSNPGTMLFIKIRNVQESAFKD